MLRAKLPHIVVSFVNALLCIPATYAFLRIIDVFFGNNINPIVIVQSNTIAMFWRLNVGLLVAMISIPLFFRIACHDLVHSIRWLSRSIGMVAIFVIVQGVFFP